jgi:TolB protein
MKKTCLLPIILALVFILIIPGLTGCDDHATPEPGVLEGKASIGPRSPEEISQPYPPEIYTPRKVMVYDTDGTKLIRQADLDKNGYYSAELPAGTYTIDINYYENDRSDDVPRKLKIEAGIHIMFDISFEMDTSVTPPTGLPEPAGSWQIGDNFYYGQESIWGDTLAGLEFKYEDGKIVGQYLSTYNLKTREKKQVLEIPASRFAAEPSIYENKIVWASVDKDEFMRYGLSSKIEPPPNYDVFLLDLATGEVRQLTTEEHAQMYPRIYADTVVWLDARNQEADKLPMYYDVLAYDLRTDEETRITANNTANHQLAISGSLLAWSDMRHADMSIVSHPDNFPGYNSEIYVYDLATGQERRITSSPLPDQSPDIDGGHIVWIRQETLQKADVFMYDLETGEEAQLSHRGYVSNGHSISGDRIVWADAAASQGNTNNDVVLNGQPPIADIFLYNLKTQKETNLTGAEAWRVWMLPVIYGNHVVFTLNRQVGTIVYAINLNSE